VNTLGEVDGGPVTPMWHRALPQGTDHPPQRPSHD
jgi:hypothetical protein